MMRGIILMHEADGRTPDQRGKPRLSPRRLAVLLRGPAGRRAFWVALSVGTLLNLINQGDALFGAGGVHWEKVMLTYLVPFCVSLHGAAFADAGDAV